MMIMPLELENKTARLTVLIDPVKKQAFEDLCARQDLTPSQVVRQLIREYLQRHGVVYSPRPGSAPQD
jgi:hypothetical protein